MPTISSKSILETNPREIPDEEIVDAIVEPRATEVESITPETRDEDVFGISGQEPIKPESLREDIFEVNPTPIAKETEDGVEERLTLVKKRLAELEALKLKNQTERKEDKFTIGQVVKIKRSAGAGGKPENGWIVSGFTEDGKVLVRGRITSKESGVNEYQQRKVTPETLTDWQKLEAEVDIREIEINSERKEGESEVLKTIVGARRKQEDLERAKKAVVNRMEKNKKEEKVKTTLEIERLSREKGSLDKRIVVLNTEYQQLQNTSEKWWSKITFGVFLNKKRMIELSDEIATLESRRNLLRETIEKLERKLS